MDNFGTARPGSRTARPGSRPLSVPDAYNRRNPELCTHPNHKQGQTPMRPLGQPPSRSPLNASPLQVRRKLMSQIVLEVHVNLHTFALLCPTKQQKARRQLENRALLFYLHLCLQWQGIMNSLLQPVEGNETSAYHYQSIAHMPASSGLP